jgi:hypothetical protein
MQALGLKEAKTTEGVGQTALPGCSIRTQAGENREGEGAESANLFVGAAAPSARGCAADQATGEVPNTKAAIAAQSHAFIFCAFCALLRQ